MSDLAIKGRFEAHRCGVSGESVGDFLSEYFLGCWLSPDPHNPALTCTCGANRARNYLRRERRWQAQVALIEPEESEPETETPEKHVLLQELQARLSAALSELTPMQQRVLYLRLTKGLPFAQIAEQTGQSSAAARVMVRSAQRRLGALLAASDFSCGEACEYLSLLDREK